MRHRTFAPTDLLLTDELVGQQVDTETCRRGFGQHVMRIGMQEHRESRLRDSCERHKHGRSGELDF